MVADDNHVKSILRAAQHEWHTRSRIRKLPAAAGQPPKAPGGGALGVYFVQILKPRGPVKIGEGRLRQRIRGVWSGNPWPASTLGWIEDEQVPSILEQQFPVSHAHLVKWIGLPKFDGTRRDDRHRARWRQLLESDIHSRFAHARDKEAASPILPTWFAQSVRGEFFWPTFELLRFIEVVCPTNAL